MTPNGNAVVLHVEDSDAMAYLLRYALREKKADVDVFRLCDGADAILYLARKGVFVEAPRPAIIVLDLELPKKHGHDILVEIRKEASFQHIPVNVFTSSVRAAEREKALARGKPLLLQNKRSGGIYRRIPANTRLSPSEASHPLLAVDGPDAQGERNG